MNPSAPSPTAPAVAQPDAPAPVRPSTAQSFRTLTRRTFLYGMAASAAAAGYSVLGEAQWLEVTRTAVKVTRVPMRRPLRIVHLSDLHASEPVPMSHIRRAVAMALEQKPDFIALTGDYITWKFTDWDDYADALAPLARFAPTFAVKGNHDGGRWTVPPDGDNGYGDSMINRFLAKAGVELLSNDARVFRLGEQEVNIMGIGDYWTRNSRPADAFRKMAAQSPASASLPTVVLAHNPDTKSVCKPYTWDLMLSGHTHGGQVRIPFLPPLRLPIKDWTCYEGLNGYDGRHVYVTRGVGSIWGVRFNCRPEVSVIELS
ncbi:phosphodiesterase [Verrucomicrobia bacterium LW23]|nr:phosphodiesterase [Verrucomicrobia bacterium LW23]